MLKRIEDLGYKIELSQEAKEFIAEQGFDSKFGARPLHRAIQKYLEDPLAEEILKGDIVEGSVVNIELDKESNLLKVIKDLPPTTPKKTRKLKGE
jgi:ATP-dependent Clp protease ATP-binding subunit ClpC